MHPLLAEGLTDAIGFVTGALIAYAVSDFFGFNPLAAGDRAIVGLVLCGIGGGAGVQLARRWRASRRKDRSG
ncbi:hypothetical protein [Caenimonas aquaedulcis]|uniref:Uncharacterized protein n=1 Tax=Caenimonas aquaedulcis TaxID=2793270 RepID=A0A931H6I2_9BURK|nr:hypothetical protein [Caenimonas aquaedulcis]MBG9389501.1 hypothetical protein [Caenimonas aquaedulcis]